MNAVRERSTQYVVAVAFARMHAVALLPKGSGARWLRRNEWFGLALDEPRTGALMLPTLTEMQIALAIAPFAGVMAIRELWSRRRQQEALRQREAEVQRARH